MENPKRSTGRCRPGPHPGVTTARSPGNTSAFLWARTLCFALHFPQLAGRWTAPGQWTVQAPWSLIAWGRPGLHMGGLPPSPACHDASRGGSLGEDEGWAGGGGLNGGRLSERSCSSSGLPVGAPPPRPLGLLVEPPSPCLRSRHSWHLILPCTSYCLRLTCRLHTVKCRARCILAVTSERLPLRHRAPLGPGASRGVALGSQPPLPSVNRLKSPRGSVCCPHRPPLGLTSPSLSSSR